MPANKRQSKRKREECLGVEESTILQESCKRKTRSSTETEEKVQKPDVVMEDCDDNDALNCETQPPPTNPSCLPETNSNHSHCPLNGNAHVDHDDGGGGDDGDGMNQTLTFYTHAAGGNCDIIAKRNVLNASNFLPSDSNSDKRDDINGNLKCNDVCDIEDVDSLNLLDPPSVVLDNGILLSCLSKPEDGIVSSREKQNNSLCQNIDEISVNSIHNVQQSEDVLCDKIELNQERGLQNTTENNGAIANESNNCEMSTDVSRQNGPENNNNNYNGHLLNEDNLNTDDKYSEYKHDNIIYSQGSRRLFQPPFKKCGQIENNKVDKNDEGDDKITCFEVVDDSNSSNKPGNLTSDYVGEKVKGPNHSSSISTQSMNNDGNECKMKKLGLILPVDDKNSNSLNSFHDNTYIKFNIKEGLYSNVVMGNQGDTKGTDGNDHRKTEEGKNQDDSINISNPTIETANISNTNRHEKKALQFRCVGEVEADGSNTETPAACIGGRKDIDHMYDAETVTNDTPTPTHCELFLHFSHSSPRVNSKFSLFENKQQSLPLKCDDITEKDDDNSLNLNLSLLERRSSIFVNTDEVNDNQCALDTTMDYKTDNNIMTTDNVTTSSITTRTTANTISSNCLSSPIKGRGTMKNSTDFTPLSVAMDVAEKERILIGCTQGFRISDHYDDDDDDDDECDKDADETDQMCPKTSTTQTTIKTLILSQESICNAVDKSQREQENSCIGCTQDFNVLSHGKDSPQNQSQSLQNVLYVRNDQINEAFGNRITETEEVIPTAPKVARPCSDVVDNSLFREPTLCVDEGSSVNTLKSTKKIENVEEEINEENRKISAKFSEAQVHENVLNLTKQKQYNMNQERIDDINIDKTRYGLGSEQLNVRSETESKLGEVVNGDNCENIDNVITKAFDKNVEQCDRKFRLTANVDKDLSPNNWCKSLKDSHRDSISISGEKTNESNVNYKINAHYLKGIDDNTPLLSNVSALVSSSTMDSTVTNNKLNSFESDLDLMLCGDTKEHNVNANRHVDDDVLFDIFHTPKDLNKSQNNNMGTPNHKTTELDIFPMRKTQNEFATYDNNMYENDPKLPNTIVDKGRLNKDAINTSSTSSYSNDKINSTMLEKDVVNPISLKLISAKRSTQHYSVEDSDMDMAMMMMSDSQLLGHEKSTGVLHETITSLNETDCQKTGDFNQNEWEQRQKVSKQQVDRKRVEGRGLVKMVLDELVAINHQVLRLKRDMDATKRKLGITSTSATAAAVVNGTASSASSGKLAQKQPQQQPHLTSMFQKMTHGSNSKSK